MRREIILRRMGKEREDSLLERIGDRKYGQGGKVQWEMKHLPINMRVVLHSSSPQEIPFIRIVEMKSHK